MQTESNDNTGILTESLADIQLKYFGSIKVAAGKGNDEVAFTPNTSVLELLLKLSDAYYESFRSELFQDNGNLRDDLMLMRNGAIIDRTRAAEIILESGDSIGLLPTFPGGG